MSLPSIDTRYLCEFMSGLCNTPSPTGYTKAGIDYVKKALSAFPQLKVKVTKKGGLLATWEGTKSEETHVLAAHVDTLGAMVKEIKPSGRLILTSVGGLNWESVEGEGCTIHTRRGKTIRGSLLIKTASAHVYGKDLHDTKREAENMEVRLDEKTSSPEETRALGIEIGDFVSFDPRFEINNNFIRSRHLDDKACVACMLAAIKALHESGSAPTQRSVFFFSNYEEVGHGGSCLPADADELLVIDMAAVGEGQESDEYHATICLKDSSGPYHYEMSEKLRNLAEKHAIAYKTDIYPYYGSDGSAYWRGGGEARVALIGPGVDASHHYERTHLDALIATTQWILAYLLD